MTRLAQEVLRPNSSLGGDHDGLVELYPSVAHSRARTPPFKSNDRTLGAPRMTEARTGPREGYPEPLSRRVRTRRTAFSERIERNRASPSTANSSSGRCETL